jgi:hypothetical protein
MQFLFVVEDVFEIGDRGCVLVPGVPTNLEKAVKVGATILIESNLGRSFETTIAAFEMIRRSGNSEHAPFSVPRDIRKIDISIGSRIFLRERKLSLYSLVRVRKMVEPVDSYDGWKYNRKVPSIGEIGTLIEILYAKDLPPKYVVESIAEDGSPLWLSEFWAEELEAADESN